MHIARYFIILLLYGDIDYNHVLLNHMAHVLSNPMALYVFTWFKKLKKQRMQTD